MERTLIRSRMESGYNSYRSRGGQVGRKSGYRKPTETMMLQYTKEISLLKKGIASTPGDKLTSIAKYPKLRLADPYKQKTAAWKIWLPIVIILLLIAAFAVLYFCGCLDFIFCGCLDFISAFRQPAQP